MTAVRRYVYTEGKGRLPLMTVFKLLRLLTVEDN